MNHNCRPLNRLGPLVAQKALNLSDHQNKIHTRIGLVDRQSPPKGGDLFSTVVS